MRRFIYSIKTASAKTIALAATIAVAGTVFALGTNEFGITSYAAETGSITTMSEKIYEQMDTNGRVVGNVISGNSFTIVEADVDDNGNVWYKIETESGVKGYIRSEKVVNSGDSEIEVSTDEGDTKVDTENNTDNDDNTVNNGDKSIETGNVKTQIIATQKTNIRQEPSTDSEVVAKMPQGTSVDSIGVRINEDGEKWYEIEYLGITGYVMDKVVDTVEVEVEETSVVETTAEQPVSNTSTVDKNESESETVISSESIVEDKSATNETEVEPTTVKKSAFNFFIDWVAIFSLVGSLLCIGVIVRLINIIKKTWDITGRTFRNV